MYIKWTLIPEDTQLNYENIKAVFFDAADTLFYIREGLGKTYSEPAKKYGVNPSPEELKKSFSKHFSAAPPLAFSEVDSAERKKLEKKWWFDVVKNVYSDLGMFENFEDYFDDLFEIFRTSAWEIFPETREVLTYLKEKDYRLVVVSNFDSRVYDVCKSLEIYDYFDDYVISSEAGYAKPDTEIFQIALSNNGITPDECIHFGDNYVNDYISPVTIGMNAVFLDRKGKYRNNDSVNSIKDLNEIKELL